MNKEPSKIVIIGGSPAAIEASCAARSFLPKAEITVIEVGEIFAHSAKGMFYYLSGDVEDFKPLNSTVYGVTMDRAFFKNVNNVDVLTGYRAVKIDRDDKTLICREEISGDKRVFHYDKLLIASGKHPVKPGIKGDDLPGVGFFASSQDAMDLLEAAEGNQLERVAVVGAGPTGCQLSESFLAMWEIEVSLIDANDFVLKGLLDRDMARIVENEINRSKVDLHLGTIIEEIKEEGGKLRVVLEKGDELPPFDRVIFADSDVPNVDLAAEAGLSIGENGGIMVDEFLRTNDPDIFAAGPSIEMENPLCGKAQPVSGDLVFKILGRIAGGNIAGGSRRAPAALSNKVIKVFDMNVGAVGMTVDEAIENGLNFEVVRGLFSDKAHYFPEVQLLSAKLLFSPDDGKILGFQAAGKGFLVRYIDTVSAFMKHNGKISDLKEFEPAFAPPLTDMYYPLHILANYAESLMRGGVEGISPLKFPDIAKDCVVLDVREDHEIADKPLNITAEQIINLPFTQLRNRISEISAGLPIIVVCGRGSRSSAAANMLKKAGFEDVSYISGGLSFFQ